jgi:hypothetical protein
MTGQVSTSVVKFSHRFQFSGHTPHAGQDQRVGFGEDEIGGEQEPVVPLRPAEQAGRVTVRGISAVEGGVKATRIHKDPVHGRYVSAR